MARSHAAHGWSRAVQLAEAGTETGSRSVGSTWFVRDRQHGCRGSGGRGAAQPAASRAQCHSRRGGSAALVDALRLCQRLLRKGSQAADCEFDDTCELQEEDDDAPNAPVSLWVRNVQLCLFSIPQAAARARPTRGVIAAHGLFAGFTPLVWLVTTDSWRRSADCGGGQVYGQRPQNVRHRHLHRPYVHHRHRDDGRRSRPIFLWDGAVLLHAHVQ